VPGIMPTLGWVAARTTSLHVGSYVYVNDLRHPLHLARDAATLQQLSGGRFELGLGVGRPGAEREYEEIGMPVGSAGERVTRLETSIRIINQLIDGSHVDHDGALYTLRDASLGRVLAGASRPHLLVAASGPRMLRLAGRVADAVALGMRPETPLADAKRLAAIIHAAAADRATPPEININLSGVGDRMINYVRPALGDRRDDLVASEAPGFLMGSVDEMTERAYRVRNVLGASYFTVSAELIDDLAPIVKRLAGQR
jgi:alkanesulfonate monooxygenase SsuD/methylene tetrahydromethanopterin reductase-like flavin-dependent oxidoreductase (luciferase family)